MSENKPRFIVRDNKKESVYEKMLKYYNIDNIIHRKITPKSHSLNSRIEKAIITIRPV